MTKEQYISELKKHLKGLSADEIEDAICYCEEYFDEAGSGNEDQVVKDLGTPAKFAAQIKADTAIKNQKDDNKKATAKSGIGTICTIILGILALPFTLSITISLIFIIAVFLLILFVAGFAILASLFGGILSGIPLLINGILFLSGSANAFIAVGAGLVCIGVCLLIATVFYRILQFLIPRFTRIITRIYHRAKEGTGDETK